MKYGPSLAITRPRRPLGGGGVNLTENMKVLFVGDSTTAGVGAGDGTGVEPEMTGARPLSVPLQCMTRLNARGITSFAETVCQDQSNGMGTALEQYRSDIESSGGYATSSRSPTIGGLLPRMNTGAQSFKFTPSVPVDTFKFGNVFGGSFGPIGVSIDGNTPVDYDQNGANGYVVETIDGLSLGAHNIEFTQSGTYTHGPGFIWAYDSNTPAVHIFNGGMRNSFTSDWTTTTYPSSTLSAMAVIAPDIVVIDLGINDWRTSGTSIASHESNLETILDQCGAIGASVILVVPHDIASYDTTTSPWDFDQVYTSYAAHLSYAQGVVGIPNAVLVDAPAAYAAAGLSGATDPATYNALNSNGYQYDGLHVRPAPYAVEGAAVADALITMLGVSADSAPSFTMSDLTFSVAASTAAGADPQGNGDETAGAFSRDPDFATIDGGTNDAHWQIVDGYKLSPSAAGDAADLSGGSGGTYTLTVTYVYAGIPQRVTVTINTT